MVMVNKKAWEALDEATQQIIRDAAATAEANGWAKSEELADWYIAQFTENGMTVADAGEGLVADFQAAGEQLKAEWLERAGERGQSILDAYQASK